MTIASIDIGSNTVLLLIAEIKPDNSILPVYHGHSMPRLGRGLKPGMRISPSATERLLEVLDEYRIKIKEFDCEKVLVTATNALRICSNQNEIRKLIKENFGWELQIIPGEEEARLSFLSASAFCGKDKCLVIDIGGGSTELIYGHSDNISFMKSYPAGAVSTKEHYLHHDPPNENELTALHSALTRTFADIPAELKNTQTAIALAGTPTTLAAMKLKLKQYKEELIEGTELTRNDLIGFTEKLSALSSDNIFHLFPEIMKGREDIILAGTLILSTLFELIEPGRLIVSARGLRYGVIIEYLNRMKQTRQV
ncbi:MAG: Ppx/GppA phosphatase family protein [Ignavibacteriaceae bacterium]